MCICWLINIIGPRKDIKGFRQRRIVFGSSIQKIFTKTIISLAPFTNTIDSLCGSWPLEHSVIMWLNMEKMLHRVTANGVHSLISCILVLVNL